MNYLHYCTARVLIKCSTYTINTLLEPIIFHRIHPLEKQLSLNHVVVVEFDVFYHQDAYLMDMHRVFEIYTH